MVVDRDFLLLVRRAPDVVGNDQLGVPTAAGRTGTLED